MPGADTASPSVTTNWYVPSGRASPSAVTQSAKPGAPSSLVAVEATSSPLRSQRPASSNVLVQRHRGAQRRHVGVDGDVVTTSRSMPPARRARRGCSAARSAPRRTAPAHRRGHRPVGWRRPPRRRSASRSDGTRTARPQRARPPLRHRAAHDADRAPSTGPRPRRHGRDHRLGGPGGFRGLSLGGRHGLGGRRGLSDVGARRALVGRGGFVDRVRLGVVAGRWAPPRPGRQLRLSRSHSITSKPPNPAGSTNASASRTRLRIVSARTSGRPAAASHAAAPSATSSSIPQRRSQSACPVRRSGVGSWSSATSTVMSWRPGSAR